MAFSVEAGLALAAESELETDGARLKVIGGTAAASGATCFEAAFGLGATATLGAEKGVPPLAALNENDLASTTAAAEGTTAEAGIESPVLNPDG